MLQGLKPGWYVAVGPGALNAAIVVVVVVIENKKTLRFCCSCFQWSTHTDNGKCSDCVTFFLAQQQIGW